MTFTLKQARKMAGKTQLQMAELLSISRETYIKLEKKPQSVKISQAKIISEITNISYDDIFFY